MNVKKFVAPTAREALRKVRDAIGPDAVILSNRPVDGVVEILAIASDDMASIALPAAGSEMAQPRPQLEVPLAFATAERIRTVPAAPTAPTAPTAPIAPIALPAAAPIAAGQHIPLRAASAPVPAAATPEAEISAMRDELRAMRGMMQAQLAEIAWGSTQQREPHKAAVLRELLAADFSATLSRYLVEKLPALKDTAASLAWVRAALSRNLQTVASEDEMLDNGGVFALVGPTGVGKTTTTAKLAARVVMRHGAGKLALITTDAYRIGAHEQLRIYGKILGVMVHSVKDEADLRIALKELRNKHTVLIDTVGVSQRDQMVAEQAAMLAGSGSDVKRLLCLNATSTNETLHEVVRAYQGSGLHGAIMTKLDEAATLGNVLDVVIRHRLNLFYVSNGQRVPEDLHLADRALLVDRAFRRGAGAQLTDDELPLVMAQASREPGFRSQREVRFG